MDKILQNRLSKIKDSMTAKLSDLQERQVIFIPLPVTARDIAILLSEEIDKVSETIVTIKNG